MEISSELCSEVLGSNAHTRAQATGLSQAANYLLDRYSLFTEHDRSLAVGAIRFFIMRRDCIDDNKPDVGLIDDISVMNFVLGKLAAPTSIFIET